MELLKWLSLFFLVSIFDVIGLSRGTVTPEISCENEEMQVDLTGLTNVTEAYLYGLKDYPDGSCQPERIDETHLRFRLSFKDFYRCGTTQILNKLTGTRTFYNRIVIVEDEGTEERVLVRCQHMTESQLDGNDLNSTLREKRDVLPAGFKEDPNLRPITEAVGYAPEPMLSMVVKREGQVIGQELQVQPGAPLTMEISLDKVSKDIYGILLSQLDVTDTGTQSEVLFHNGCSVDSYLFENFVTEDGNVLTAKFKAFKFPDTNYVLFRGTVNVCLNACKGIQCSNGQTGYGRRRRTISSPPDTVESNYEVHTTTILRVADMTESNVGSGHRGVLGSSYGYQPRTAPGIAENAKQTLTPFYSDNAEIEKNSAFATGPVTTMTVTAVTLLLIRTLLFH